MQTRALGATGEQVSALCMGCWEIGGLAWGPIAAPDAVRLVQEAFDAGITTFDTAEAYGNGRSETIIGQALKGRRDDAFLISKVGYLPGVDGAQVLLGSRQPQDFSAERIRSACDLALRRLQTGYIDAYVLHDPPMHIVEQEAPIAALQQLQQAGKIRWWGVSAQPEVTAEAIRRWGAPVVEAPFNAAQTDAASSLLPVAAEHGTGVFARSPFASGLLVLSAEEIQALPTTDWRQQQVFKDRVGPAVRTREVLQTLADQRDELAHETAIRFVLGHNQVSTCIVGLARSRDIALNAPAAGPPYLTPDEIAEIEGSPG